MALYLRNSDSGPKPKERLTSMIKTRSILSAAIILFLASGACAQSSLPDITVKNINGKIIVSWVHDYKETITNIFIQRSYDSLKGYSTIGSVLNPMNKENGYADASPPYNKMYYRVSVTFEGGKYFISKPVRPVKEIPPMQEEEKDNVLSFRYPWQISPIRDSAGNTINLPIRDSIQKAPPLVTPPVLPPVKKEPTYPSQRIFTARDNNIVVYLPDFAIKKYHVKFYNESNQFLFELNKLQEEYLIIDKVNFVRTGWYFFELFDGEKLVEKNKFLIDKDGKKK